MPPASEALKKAIKKWRNNNRDYYNAKQNEYTKKYNEKNREAKLAYAKQYREKQKELKKKLAGEIKEINEINTIKSI